MTTTARTTARVPERSTTRTTVRPPEPGAGRCPESGQITAFVVILMTALLACAGLSLDLGLALSSKLQLLDIAQGAARVGAEQIDLTALRETGQLRIAPATARSAAGAWLARTGHTGTITATAQTVTVIVDGAYRTQLLRIVGVSTVHLTATATAAPTRGPDTGTPP